MKKVLGIDPSINHLGVAVLTETGSIEFVNTYHTKMEGNLRYYEIYKYVKDLCKHFQITDVGIETQYISMVRSNTVFMIAEVKAVCRIASYESIGTTVFHEVSPTEAKAVAGISGKRDKVKKLAVEAVHNLYPGLGKIDDNAADAILIAHTILARQGYRNDQLELQKSQMKKR